MHWLEALEFYLQHFIRQGRRRPYVTCAVVETAPPARVKGSQEPRELIGGWLIEERRTPRGNIALHLFPSAS